MTLKEAQALRQALKAAGRKMSNQEALQALICFDPWKPGVEMIIDTRIRYGDSLYRVRQTHTAQEGRTPNAVPALFELIEWQHSGTADDPIPWRSGLACELGLYYMEDGITYRATRDSGNPLYYTCAELVGVYFQAL